MMMKNLMGMPMTEKLASVNKFKSLLKWILVVIPYPSCLEATTILGGLNRIVELHEIHTKLHLSK
jgi:hypothetical protein